MDTQTSPALVTAPRAVERLITGQATSDGAGVKLTRVLTQDLQHRLDPFLMLDAFGSDAADDYIAGFPDHPHRGFETVTYMLAGRMRHRDSAGNEGLLQGGGVQWMTAGRGVIHSEMPEQNEGLHGGLPALAQPAGQGQDEPALVPRHRRAPRSPSGRAAGVTARVIAGTSHGVAGAMQREGTEPLYLDMHLAAGAHLRAAAAGRSTTPSSTSTAARCRSPRRTVPRQRMAILANTRATACACRRWPKAPALLLIAGRPLNEPIVQYGPFVMNTQEEIFQAVEDFQRRSAWPRAVS